MSNPPINSMSLLQSDWYNTFSSALGSNTPSFQLLQPAVDITHNAALWALQNQIPPDISTWNSWIYQTNNLFQQYSEIVAQLTFPESQFEKDIGTDNYNAWLAYLKTQPKPPANELPTLFREWAMLNAPGIANIGSSDLAKMILINSAKASITPYLGPSPKPVDFTDTMDSLTEILQQASPKQIHHQFSPTSAQHTLSKGGEISPCFFGIWSGSWPTAPIHIKFAQSQLTITLDIAHLTVQSSIPGEWYNSSLLNLALSTKSSPPWPAGKNLWENYFGTDGTLQKIISNIVVVSDIHISILSDAVFTESEQKVIMENVKKGVWPFYYQSNSHITNKATFTDNKLQLTTESHFGVPLILAINTHSTMTTLGR